jgi:hypothetical protein
MTMERTTIHANDMLGTWALETVGGGPPGASNIKSWQIVFSADNQWTYSGEMTGTFAGMQVNGSGTWGVISGVLDYSVEGSEGRSTATIRERILTLTPDPVIMPDGKTAAVTTYRQAKIQ